MTPKLRDQSGSCKGFERIELPAGQKKTVVFSLQAKALEFWSDANHQFVLEKDQVDIGVGRLLGSSSVASPD